MASISFLTNTEIFKPFVGEVSHKTSQTNHWNKISWGKKTWFDPWYSLLNVSLSEPICSSIRGGSSLLCSSFKEATWNTVYEFYDQSLAFNRNSINVSSLIHYVSLQELVHYSVSGSEEEFEKLTFSSHKTTACFCFLLRLLYGFWKLTDSTLKPLRGVNLQKSGNATIEKW